MTNDDTELAALLEAERAEFAEMLDRKSVV